MSRRWSRNCRGGEKGNEIYAPELEAPADLVKPLLYAQDRSHRSRRTWARVMERGTGQTFGTATRGPQATGRRTGRGQAISAGVVRMYIGAMERGEANVTLDHLRKITDAL